MPQASSITLTVGATPYVYLPVAINGGIVTFQQEGADTLSGANELSVAIRDVTASQTTRKSSLKLVDQLINELEEGCCGPATSRGSEISGLDFTFPVTATAAERALIFDKLVAALSVAKIRQSIINNERWWG